MSHESNNTALKNLKVLRQALAIGALLIILGISLSYVVNPYFILLPLLVSGGLTVSALFGWCPMIHVLERMPWNNKA